jgi:hypothetical protein
MADPADLDARPVVFSASFRRFSTARLLRFSSMSMKSMTIRPGEIAQAQLAGDLVGGLEIGLERGVLDIVLAGRAPGIHVDRDQRLGRVDDEIAAGLQRDLRARTSRRAAPRRRRLAKSGVAPCRASPPWHGSA